MNKQRIYIGVDVSKKTVDLTALINGEAIHTVENNTQASISKWVKLFMLTYELDPDQLVFGIENTGRYSWPVTHALVDQRLDVYLLSALHLKKSQGLVRGKSDQVDSERIARFISKNVNEIAQYVRPREVVEQMGLLLSVRDKLLRQLVAESQTKEELLCVGKSGIKTFILNESRKAIISLKKRIDRIEAQINDLVKTDEVISRQVTLAQSVPGVGRVLSWNLITKTNEFKNFKDPRKLACFSGVAPFEHSSGTSIRGKTRVSHYADKTMKKCLHMAALSAIRVDGELRSYYLRKVDEGKNKMLVINAVRNKIVHRVMAAIINDRPYQRELKNDLVLS